MGVAVGEGLRLGVGVGVGVEVDPAARVAGSASASGSQRVPSFDWSRRSALAPLANSTMMPPHSPPGPRSQTSHGDASPSAAHQVWLASSLSVVAASCPGCGARRADRVHAEIARRLARFDAEILDPDRARGVFAGKPDLHRTDALRIAAAGGSPGGLEARAPEHDPLEVARRREVAETPPPDAAAGRVDELELQLRRRCDAAKPQHRNVVLGQLEGALAARDHPAPRTREGKVEAERVSAFHGLERQRRRAIAGRVRAPAGQGIGRGGRFGPEDLIGAVRHVGHDIRTAASEDMTLVAGAPGRSPRRSAEHHLDRVRRGVARDRHCGPHRPGPRPRCRRRSRSRRWRRCRSGSRPRSRSAAGRRESRAGRESAASRRGRRAGRPACRRPRPARRAPTRARPAASSRPSRCTTSSRRGRRAAARRRRRRRRRRARPDRRRPARRVPARVTGLSMASSRAARSRRPSSAKRLHRPRARRACTGRRSRGCPARSP